VADLKKAESVHQGRKTGRSGEVDSCASRTKGVFDKGTGRGPRRFLVGKQAIDDEGGWKKAGRVLRGPSRSPLGLLLEMPAGPGNESFK